MVLSYLWPKAVALVVVALVVALVVIALVVAALVVVVVEYYSILKDKYC